MIAGVRHAMRLLFAVVVIGVGVWLIVTAHEPTETLTARVSASRLSVPNRADKVDFTFADGSQDDVVSPTAEGFYDAVARFGPGPARVTRNEANDSIYEVEFHGETYTLDSPGTDLGGGIIAVVLGGLGLAYLVITGRGGRRRSGEEQEPAGGEEQEPVSDIARLAALLHLLADDIASDDPDDAGNARWSATVRTCAFQVGAGQRAGLDSFLDLFSNDPRNTINEQPFARTGRFEETMRLASRLRREASEEDSRREEAERGLVLVPWSEGSNGKAVVYKDGTVITTDDDAPGNPQFADLYDAAGQAGNHQVAIISIGPDGSCDAYRVHCEEKWLAATLHAHHPLLHLVGPPPPRT